jgi:molecular chaperone DnaJ
MLSVQGRPGQPGSLPGDLSIRVEVQPHALLQLDPDGTVLCDMPVDGFMWIANRWVDVPTVGGLQPVQLLRDQLRYRLKGQGFPVERRGARGDQLVTVTPVFPQHLSTDQQILLDQLIATTSDREAQPIDERLRGWNKTLRQWQRGPRARR